MATCIERTGGIARYSDVIYGHHLISKVSKNFASGTGAALPQQASTEQMSKVPQGIELPSPAITETQSLLSAVQALPAITTTSTVAQEQMDTVLKALIAFVEAGTKIIQALTPPGTPTVRAQAPAQTALQL